MLGDPSIINMFMSCCGEKIERGSDRERGEREREREKEREREREREKEREGERFL